MTALQQNKKWGVRAVAKAHHVVRRRPMQVRDYRGFLAWSMCIVAMSFVLFQFAIQLSSGQLIQGLKDSFHVSLLGASFIASSYYYIYVALQTPAGVLMDRFGPRFLLGAGAFICALGCAFFAVSHTTVQAVLSRVVMGAGAAFAFVGCSYLVGKWFPARRFAFLIGILEMVGVLGSMLGGVLIAAAVQHLGWRISMWVAAAIAFVLSIALYAIVRDMPAGAVVRRRLVTLKKQEKFWQHLKALLAQGAVWINAFYSGVMFSVVTVFVAFWGVPFYEKARHLDIFHATLVCDMISVGIAIGCPVIGWLNPRLKRRSVFMSVLAAVSGVLFILVLFFPALPISIEGSLLFMLGLCVGSYMLTFAIASEIAKPAAKGAALGFTNTISVGMAPLLQPLVALIMHWVITDGHQSSAMPISYQVADYQHGLLILPALMFVMAILAWFLPERNVLMRRQYISFKGL